MICHRPSYLPPKAWLGYKVNPGKGFMVRICCMCPDQAEAMRQAHPLPVTHTYCAEHAAAMMAEVTGEKIPA
jgi:hypothetical protein